MPKRKGISRDQVLLLPERVEDYITEENPTRFVDAFVESLDLKALGLESDKRVQAGAPSYDPAALLKLYIYGYLNRIRSSRELEKATKRNLEVIWLMRKLQPDHWTINEFRKKHAARFKRVFREFNLVCGQLGLFGGELVAIDSAYFKGVNNPARNFTKAKLKTIMEKIDQKTEAYLAQLEANDTVAIKHGLPGKNDLEEKLNSLKEKRAEAERLLAMVEESPTQQVSQTDPESRSLKKSGQSTVGYNVQMAVDAKHKLIAVNETLKTGSDVTELFNMSMQAKEILQVERLKVVADCGYYKIAQVKACDENGIESYVPEQKENKTGDGSISVKDFVYNEEKDVLICPMGKELARRSRKVHQVRDNYYHVYHNAEACRQCPILKKCTSSTYRNIMLHVDHKVVLALRDRLKQNPDIMRKRGALVEHPFGTMKFGMGCGTLLTRGWRKVSGEVNLTMLAYNMKRVLNLLPLGWLLDLFKTTKRVGYPA